MAGRPPLATVDDLVRLLGAPIDTGAPQTQATALLEMASEHVRAFAGQTWLNSDESALIDGTPKALSGVVVGMVYRAIRNPDGAVSATAGPFARDFGPDAAARIYLTKGDKDVIAMATGSNPAGIGVISTTRGPMETTNVEPIFNTGGADVLPPVEDVDPWALWGGDAISDDGWW